MRSARRHSIAALVLGTLVIAACASPESEDTDANEADITDRLPPANAAPVLDAEEFAFVNALNAYRVTKLDTASLSETQKLLPVSVSIGLVKAARKHSKEMADLNAVDATHNDGGKGDQGALHDEAMRATRARIKAEYPLNADYDVHHVGEDCARREDIGSASAAFTLVRENLADSGNPGFTDLPGSALPNMLNAEFRAIGVARAQGSNGKWYWTVTYGQNAAMVPLLSLDDSIDQSLLSNGSFEDEYYDGLAPLFPGNWNTSASWDPDFRRKWWHSHADHGGSVTVRADNAFFLDGTPGVNGKAHGLRIVDPPGAGATANATQLVPAVPGVNYELSARARRVGSDDSQPALYLDFTDDKFKRVGVTTVKAGAPTSWNAEPIRVSATSPARTAYVRVILYATTKAGHGSTYDWDDVRLRAW